MEKNIFINAISVIVRMGTKNINCGSWKTRLKSQKKSVGQPIISGFSEILLGQEL